MNRFTWAAAILFAIFSLAGPAAADYAAGVEAYDSGDFELAMAEFRPLLERGHRGAELMVGVMYLRGQGFSQDEGLAAVWMYKAARKGEPGAQLVLGSQHLYGRGVRRDLIEAYRWLTLAAESGVAGVAQQAISYRDDAAEFLSPDEVADALRRAKSFSPGTDRFVNQ